MQQRTLAAAALVVVWHAAAGPPAQHAPPGSTFRVFLRTGEPLPSYGEAAIVGDRVVFTLLVGGESDLRRRFQLVDLAADDVDLDRTVAYATAVRGDDGRSVPGARRATRTRRSRRSSAGR
jgi:hypothetical protein